MTQRKYVIYDVFTDRVLAGNPLAIVLDSQGLDTERMQAIAGEFNLSETVFVAPAKNTAYAAAIRIFTPKAELPFAGHPTVGTAVALAELDGEAAGVGRSLVLEEKIGDVRCAVTRGCGASFAEFELPQLSAPGELAADAGAIAAALGLREDEIGFDDHRPGVWSAGVPFLTVPVRDLEVAGRARIDRALWVALSPRVNGAVCAPYVYCRETVDPDCAFHARMFAPWKGITEDPATGSAVAAFSGAVVHCDRPADGTHKFGIEQGIEMGRPSRIGLEIDVQQGSARSARIGGHAVKVAEGTLFL